MPVVVTAIKKRPSNRASRDLLAACHAFINSNYKASLRLRLAVFGHQWPMYNHTMNRRSALLTGAGALAQTLHSQEAPLRVAIAGLVHGHARGFFNKHLSRKDVQIVGVAEHDAEVRKRYFAALKLDASLAFDSVETMIA